MINPIVNLAASGDYEVTYLFQYWSDEEKQRAEHFFAAYQEVNLVATCNQTRFNVNERDIHLEIPLEVFNAMDLAYYQELERLFRASQFDLVQVEHSWMAWVVPLIRTIAPNVPIILDLHNVEATLFERWVHCVSESEREEMAVRWKRMRCWEEETWQWYDACFAVSPFEVQAFEKQTGQRIPTWELPTGGGIDLSRFLWTNSEPRRKRETVLSLGTLAWSANVQGLFWFIDEVMPLLKKTHPCARLYIVGFGTPPSELIQRIQDRKDVIFLGEQEDERQLLNQSQVFIVPLWIGAGARVKIPTAWAAGIPVVATTIGAEGLHYTDGENILIADDPGGFAQKIAILMDDEELARRISHNGRAVVEERYSLDYAVKGYDRIYRSIVSGAGLSTTIGSVGFNFEEREKAIRHLVQLKTDIKTLIGLGRDNGSLMRIEHSLGWRMLTNYYRVVNKLLPQSTRRRGLLDLGLIGVKIIIDEGWRSFFRKLRLWLHSRVSKRGFQ